MFTPEWRKLTDTNGGQPEGSAGLFDFSPFPAFSLFAAIALVVASAVFYTHYKEVIDNQNWEVTNVSQLRAKSNLGYSFFLGIAALVANILGVKIIGGMTSCLTSTK
ncbi:hypothetical protein M3Y99_00047800 [Aphelenchoides fujianensis]|nr:hypothetical protein M3Y99_00047800 [Aphelenchoides fujianensis]